MSDWFLRLVVTHKYLLQLRSRLSMVKPVNLRSQLRLAHAIYCDSLLIRARCGICRANLMAGKKAKTSDAFP